jgi:patatin-like phospholipase/acyl hydrolase
MTQNQEAMSAVNVSISSTLPMLTLDGGGSKGMYTLGVLNELEAAMSRPLCECFSLIYGTSTGAIIAALLGLGTPVKQILNDLARVRAIVTTAFAMKY